MTSTAGSGNNGPVSDTDNGRPSTADATGHVEIENAVMGEKEEEEERDKQRMEEMMDEEKRAQEEEESTIPPTYARAHDEAEAGQLNEEATLPPDPDVATPLSESSSFVGPNDTLSVEGSVISSPSSSRPASRASSRFGLSPATQPFERRFKARITSPSPIPRAIAPAFLTTHSRQASTSSQLTLRSQEENDDQYQNQVKRPWEVVRWTRLKRISQQAFSESGKRAFGQPTFLTIGSSIAIGTSKGIILLFDYQQTLKGIIGQGTIAAECGPITSLAISADHSTVAAGHANGTIFTWDLAGSARPFLHIPPIPRSQAQSRPHDGHLADSAVLHVGFLGQRHTALASADDSGMAFAHLATRGLGAIGRTVKTTRILGRYPYPSTVVKKPSSVLAFAPLPLGNVEQVTDDFGLTALLTPYLLVVISTTPTAETQYKAPRLKNIAAHSAMTGCLAWFPAVRLKDSAKNVEPDTSATKLVYCWSNILNVFSVEEKKHQELRSPEKRAELDFTAHGQWVCDEAILAVQWLSRSIIALLTITQRLIILEDRTFRVADSADLNSKHIYHQDLFSRQLQPLVDKVELGDGSLHGVLPDAYHMSFKVYKGRLFLLGVNDVSMGTLSNWADRLTATLEAGNPITAVELALSYYTGETDKVTIGLPDDENRRHGLVKEKLLDLLSGSLAYILNDETTRDTESGLRTVLQEFADVAFRACTITNEADYLFDEIYEYYSDASMPEVFLFELESYIIDAKVTLIPPVVFKDLMIWYETLDLGNRLQVIICSLQTATMDIDQVSEVCKRMQLYDALIYVWNQALDDFVTPLIDLISLIPEANETQSEEDHPSPQHEACMKMFPYMAYTLTGRRYPNGEQLSDQQSIRGRLSMYAFLLSSRVMRWPQSDGREVTFEEMDTSASYPYLHHLLDFDPFNLLSMLNEAFEDSFLSDEDEQTLNGGAGQDIALTTLGGPVTRQRIVRVLLEIVTPSSFAPDEKILLDIFLARNLAKFPQDILLSGSDLRQILVELCNTPQETLRDECELSVEYLLTVYHPPDTQELVDLLSKAKYNRALKSTYRSNRQCARWLESHFDDDEDRESVFNSIGDCLRAGSGLSKRQVTEVKDVIKSHGRDLMSINPALSATTLQMYAPDLMQPVLDTTVDDTHAHYRFLQPLLEPTGIAKQVSQNFAHQHQEDYVKLMCQHQPHHVADYITLVESGDLRLDEVLPAMEQEEVLDAMVILLQHDGMGRNAMDRLMKHLTTLRTALRSLLHSDTPDARNTEEAVEDLLREIDKYVKLGIWLCQGEASRAEGESFGGSPKIQRRSQLSLQYTEDDLTSVERLWLDLIDTTVSIHQAIADLTNEHGELHKQEESNEILVTASLAIRILVQSTFTALLAASVPTSKTTPTNTRPSPSRQSSSSGRPQVRQAPRFPPVLSTLLTRLSRTVSSTSTILPLLSNLLSSHAFESSILTLAHSFLDKDVFALVQEADAKRRQGWRPSGRGCEVCGRRCWGPGAGVGIWEKWEEQQAKREVQRRAHGRDEEEETRGRGKGKARATEEDTAQDPSSSEEAFKEEVDSLVVFSCHHMFHRNCLESALNGGLEDAGGRVEYKCPKCR